MRVITWKGRGAKTPSIEEIRELTVEEVRAMPRATLPRVQKLRNSHHMLARLDALGTMTLSELSVASGYSISGISMLRQDPSYQQLVLDKRAMLDEQYVDSMDQYYTGLLEARNKSLRLINDKLDQAEPGDIPLNQLHAIHSDAADRTGYPKRKESVNMNLDFADSLDQAIARSRQVKLIEHKSGEVLAGPSPEPPALDGAGGGTEVGDSPPKAMVEQPPAPIPPRSPTIRDLLPPNRYQKAAMQRRA